jgi:hypothetical protein
MAERRTLMFDYLSPKDGPVFEGLEQDEVVYGKDQPQYLWLRTIVSQGDDRRVTSRWTLTNAQREAIMEGADIFLELSTFGQPLQPTRLAIGDEIDINWVKEVLLSSPLPLAEGIAIVEVPTDDGGMAEKMKAS